MRLVQLRSVLLSLTALLAWGAAHTVQGSDRPGADERKAFEVEYLEIVTPDVEATCALLEEARDVAFGEPVAALGNARTAKLAGGGRIGVRAPLHDAEEPTVRPYVLVEDVAETLAAAEAAGAQVLHPPLAIPGQGKFALYLLGGIQHGLWEN